jgi:EAL domain-containing protein (putative c-di-GMP-specific phosphodiesterase class I)
VQTLADIGVDYVQGFVVSKSRDPNDMLPGDASADFIQDEGLKAMAAGLEDQRRLQPDLSPPGSLGRKVNLGS